MSEAEKKRRAEYQRLRKNRIWIQAAVIMLIAVLLIASCITYFRLSKTDYINYTQSSTVNYKVHLKENDMFDEDILGPNMTYIADVIDKLNVNFSYVMDMQDTDATHTYSYGIVAKVLITDNKTGNVIHAPEYELVNVENLTKKSSSELKISESILIDYSEYDKIATEFLNVYDIREEAKATLVLTLSVDVTSRCLSSGRTTATGDSSYNTSLSMPLAVQMTSAQTEASAPNGETRVLACTGSVNPMIFKVIAIVLFIVELILAGVLIAFIYLTRNHDINYAIKVKKLMSNYKSYIQQIKNEFDREGYQILYVSAFSEMLEIRDTIQSPILMYENEDKTRSEFFITTNTKILYLFEIKVEDYDEIYAQQLPEEPEGPEELIEEDLVLEEIDYVDEIDEETDDGVEVIGVVWPEKEHKNKIYRYDPSGETVYDGDVVLVPSRDHHSNKDIVRKAAVAHGNHRVDPATLKHPLKKIISVVKRRHE